jgi:hypothetical protein
MSNSFKKFIFLDLFYILFGIFTIITSYLVSFFLLPDNKLIGDIYFFVFISLFLVVTYIIYIKKSHAILLHPIVLIGIGLLFAFFIPSQFTILLAKESFLEYNNSDVNKILFYSLIAFYSISLGNILCENFLSSRILDNFKNNLNKRNIINDKLVFNLFLITLFLRLIAVKLGIYGYDSTGDFIENINGYSNILLTFASYSDYIFILATLSYFTNKNNSKIKFYLIFTTQIIFGFLSGFKGNVIYPIFTFIIISYLITGLINKKYIIFLFFGMLFALIIIEPYRLLKTINPDKEVTFKNYIEIYNLASNVDYTNFYKSNSEDNLAVKFFFRKNLLESSAAGIHYFEQQNFTLNKNSPPLLNKIFLSPFLAYIPRFIWKNKPINLDGLWYSNEVIGSPYFTFTPLGKIVYLFFSGGLAIIIIGFIFMGILQNYLYKFIDNSHSSASLFLYIFYYDVLTNLEQSYDLMLIIIMQSIPIFIILYKFCFIKRKMVYSE